MLLVGIIALVAWLASCLIGANMAGSMIASEARTANALQRLQAANAEEVNGVAQTLDEATRKIFASRFVVVRVAPEVWPCAVLRLSAVASFILIDVSEPTDSLLWEIEHLILAGRQSRCIFTCHGDRLDVFAAASTGSPVFDLRKQRLSDMLEGHQVLAYTSDPRGARRFARALRAALIDAKQPRRTAQRPR
jgi:hypothetical protein